MVKEMRWGSSNHWPILLKGHSKYTYNPLKIIFDQNFF